jgi:1,2-diacylglycerol 3-beta-glucosyltransferase
MPESSWRENDSYNELELGALLADLSPLADDEDPESPKRDRRRRKAAIVFCAIWMGTIALHLVTWGSWVALGLTAMLAVHAARILTVRPRSVPTLLTTEDPEHLPRVTLMVAAKNEEAVIGRLVKTLCSLDYPAQRYELWVIDDNSGDRTGVFLDQLTQEYEQLRVVHRPANASGGKSGALNQVLPLTRGEIIAVFDADAQVPQDMLRRVLPLFQRQQLGAVQVRKAISNVSANFWTRGQAVEMLLDSYFQQQRIAVGGVGELRGNGQFVRRAALEHCGGWNEETITDDLDLTIRLHLDQWDVDFMMVPQVEEEGVTRALSLWHQRNRWAEGGYQRYLDYWRPLVLNRMGFLKTFDLAAFWIIQYLLPTAMIPDALMAVLRHRPLLCSPLTTFTLLLQVVGILFALRQMRQFERQTTDSPRLLGGGLTTLWQTLYTIVYLFHWVPVVSTMTARVAVRAKRLKWVKTTHQGEADLVLEVPD